MFTTKLIGINFLDILYVQVTVLEEKDVVGGACRTEYPFAKAPALGQSTGKAELRVCQREAIMPTAYTLVPLPFPPRQEPISWA